MIRFDRYDVEMSFTCRYMPLLLQKALCTCSSSFCRLWAAGQPPQRRTRRCARPWRGWWTPWSSGCTRARGRTPRAPPRAPGRCRSGGAGEPSGPSLRRPSPTCTWVDWTPGGAPSSGPPQELFEASANQQQAIRSSKAVKEPPTQERDFKLALIGSIYVKPFDSSPERKTDRYLWMKRFLRGERRRWGSDSQGRDWLASGTRCWRRSTSKETWKLRRCKQTAVRRRRDANQQTEGKSRLTQEAEARSPCPCPCRRWGTGRASRCGSLGRACGPSADSPPRWSSSPAASLLEPSSRACAAGPPADLQHRSPRQLLCPSSTRRCCEEILYKGLRCERRGTYLCKRPRRSPGWSGGWAWPPRPRTGRWSGGAGGGAGGAAAPSSWCRTPSRRSGRSTSGGTCLGTRSPAPASARSGRGDRCADRPPL